MKKTTAPLKPSPVEHTGMGAIPYAGGITFRLWAPHADIVAFHRWCDDGEPGEDVIVVANLANRADEGYNIGFPHKGIWRVRFNSDWKGYDPTFSSHLTVDTEAVNGGKDGMPFNGNVSIGPYSVVIFSQDPKSNAGA